MNLSIGHPQPIFFNVALGQHWLISALAMNHLIKPHYAPQQGGRGLNAAGWLSATATELLRDFAERVFANALLDV